MMADPEAHTESPAEEDGDDYPPRKVVIPAMVAIYLAVFLIALVSRLIRPANARADAVAGSNHLGDSNPRHLQRISELRRSCLVRGGVSTTALHAAIDLWPRLREFTSRSLSHAHPYAHSQLTGTLEILFRQMG
jgi:hypothetical protein